MCDVPRHSASAWLLLTSDCLGWWWRWLRWLLSKPGNVKGPMLWGRVGVAAVGILAIVCAIWFANFETLRWTMSALAQSSAALLGLVLILATFIHEKARQAKEVLASERKRYVDLLDSGYRGPERPAHMPDIEAVRQAFLVELRKDNGLRKDEHYRELAREFNSVERMVFWLSALSVRVMDEVPCDYSWDEIERQLVQAGLLEEDARLLSLAVLLLNDPLDFYRVLHGVLTKDNTALWTAGGSDLIRRMMIAGYKDGAPQALGTARQRERLWAPGFILALLGCVGAFLIALPALMLCKYQEAPWPARGLAVLSLTAIGVALWALAGFVYQAFIRQPSRQVGLISPGRRPSAAGGR